MSWDKKEFPTSENPNVPKGYLDKLKEDTYKTFWVKPGAFLEVKAEKELRTMTAKELAEQSWEASGERIAANKENWIQAFMEGHAAHEQSDKNIRLFLWALEAKEALHMLQRTTGSNLARIVLEDFPK